MLEIEQFYVSSSSQNLQKFQGSTNIEGTNILRSIAYILVPYYLFW